MSAAKTKAQTIIDENAVGELIVRRLETLLTLHSRLQQVVLPLLPRNQEHPL